MSKYQLIVLRDGRMIIVSDEQTEPHEDYTYILDKSGNKVRVKMIASNHLGGLPSIDFSSLSEEDCKRIGYIDVEKLAYTKCQSECIVDEYGKATEEGLIMFKEGFKAAQSMSDKQFSLEDMFNIAKIAAGNYKGGGFRTEEQIKEYIQFLSQPKVFDIELEMEFCLQPCGNGYYSEPKITNNFLKIVKIL